jgi:hypothetical protein
LIPATLGQIIYCELKFPPDNCDWHNFLSVNYGIRFCFETLKRPVISAFLLKNTNPYTKRRAVTRSNDDKSFGQVFKVLIEKMNLDASIVTALESDRTNPGNGSAIPQVEAIHSQLNWQVIASNDFQS